MGDDPLMAVFIILSLILSYFLTGLFLAYIYSLSTKYGILDQPASGRIHKKPVPRLGGAAIWAGWAGSVTLIYFIFRLTGYNCMEARQFLTILAGSAVFMLIGLIDDLYGIRARVKLALQFIVVLLLAYFSIRVTLFTSYNLSIYALNFIITYFWFLIIINGINFIDGMDGLASTVFISSLAAPLAIACAGGNIFLAVFITVAGGAVLRFFKSNCPPADIFMGDSGSYFLGFILSVITLLLQYRGPAFKAFTIPVLIAAAPIAEASFIIIWRLKNRRPLFQGDLNHSYNILLNKGHGEKKLLALAALGVLAVQAIASALYFLIN